MDVSFMEPDVSLPRELIAYIGSWEGRWQEREPSVLVIRSIEPLAATTIFASNGFVHPMLTVHQVTPGGLLLHETTVTALGGSLTTTYTWELREGVLLGERRVSNSTEVRTVEMHRCSSLFVPAPLNPPAQH